MASEVFLLKKLKDYNQFGLWPFSFLMHWGIYLLFLWFLLLAVEARFKLGVLSSLVNFLGPVAFISGAFGSLGLIFKRVGNEKLGSYTTPEDYFNLIFLGAVFGSGLIAWSYVDLSFDYTRALIKQALFFEASPVPAPFWVWFNLLLFELFLIYLPFSKLFHYAIKYLTFDKILWDDAFKVKDSSLDRKIAKQLAYVVSWAGPHVVPGKTWLEEAQLIDGGGEK